MIRRHLRSNIVGYIALFVALSASAYAAGLKKNSVTSKAIKDGAVGRTDIAADAVDGSKVEDGSLTGSDFGGTLPQGPQGPAGSPDTGSQILDKLAPVDGGGSGLDADQIDGTDSEALVKLGDGAGGDLAGNYPSPTIKPGVVGPDEMSLVPSTRLRAPLESSTCFGAPSIPGDGTLEPLAWGTEYFDRGNQHAPTPCSSTSRIAAPINGIYLISASVVWTNSTGGTRFTGIRLNGNNDNFLAATRSPAFSDVPEQSVSTIQYLSAGTYAEVVLSQNSGSPVTLDNQFERQSFQMVWIAP